MIATTHSEAGLKKARAHADSVYAAALDSTTNEFQKRLAALRSKWATQGMAISGGWQGRSPSNTEGASTIWFRQDWMAF